MSNIFYPYPSNLDFSEHRLKNPNLTFYGLPKEVKFVNHVLFQIKDHQVILNIKMMGKVRKKQ